MTNYQDTKQGTAQVLGVTQFNPIISCEETNNVYTVGFSRINEEAMGQPHLPSTVKKDYEQSKLDITFNNMVESMGLGDE